MEEAQNDRVWADHSPKLREWMDEAALLSACHSRSASLFNSLFRSLGVCNIVFSAGAASLSLSSMDYEYDVRKSRVSKCRYSDLKWLSKLLFIQP